MADDEETKKKRITVGLDEFDHAVVSKMANNRRLHLSEVIRTIVHQWIEFNPDLLKKNYGIDLKEVTEELLRESYEISLDKSLKPFEEKIINDLPNVFANAEVISVHDLAEHFEVDDKAIKRIMFTHNKKIKELGLNLILTNDIITKISE